MKMDWMVLGFVAGVLILGNVNRGIWFDWIMGALLVCGGVWIFLIGLGALPRFRNKPTVIPYPVLGTVAIVQGIALGIFHYRF